MQKGEIETEAVKSGSETASGKGEFAHWGAGEISPEFQAGKIGEVKSVDRFAAVLRVDVAALRQDVRTAADHALLAVAIRRDDRKAVADGKRWLKVILQAERSARQVSRLKAEALAKSTVSRDGQAANLELLEITIQQSVDFSTNLREVHVQRAHARLSAGGGSDQDRLAAVLIERLARIWSRYTNRPAPGGASGPFVDFVVAAWSHLGLSEFIGRNGEPQPLADAIGNRIVKFHRRHNRDQNNQALCHKPPRRDRASSRPTNRR
ncbi:MULTISPECIES: hypothetical protein [unclassified Bradyrhizobium]|uniref:hypothetical protein n=1 Tax=Bradyrhizobium sp. USDA 4541 TaxID=2817704 RepID=UPI0020A40327|nr:hypothetical protein [Bradyrhizobium sp. USDA 4541]MCP1851234.1 hypothetical protein [Bradyrhizobium sp. USDA 4541]